MITRRDFLETTLASGVAVAGVAGLAGSAVGAASVFTGRGDEPSRKPEKPAAKGGKKILILGGTGFLGPAILDAAKAAGHSVTLFNRGKTEKKKLGAFDNEDKIYGNRDPKLRADDADPNSPMGLSALEGRSWDAVVDTSGYFPRIVKASAEMLASKVGLYVFISTISVYQDNNTPDADESAKLGVMEDPTVESMGGQQQNYGPLKALCEQAAEAAMPGRVLTIRPGYIVGPNDPTDRFTYWPVRATKGGTMLAPGSPTDPVMIIDVRDLGEWIVRCIEKKTTGIYNATGPAGGMPWKAALDACVVAGNAGTKLEWVPTEFLGANGVGPGGDCPIWIPPVGEYAGFHQRNIDKAIAAGLTFRPVLETCKALVEWWPKEVDRRTRVGKQMVDDAIKAGKEPPQLPHPEKLRAGMDRAKEEEVLAKWAASKKGGNAASKMDEPKKDVPKKE